MYFLCTVMADVLSIFRIGSRRFEKGEFSSGVQARRVSYTRVWTNERVSTSVRRQFNGDVFSEI